MSDSVRPHRRQPTRLQHPWDSPGKNTGVGCYFLLQCMKVKSESEVAQSCPTLNDPMDCSLPGSSIRGILQARILEWGAIAFSVMAPQINFACYFLFYWRLIDLKCYVSFRCTVKWFIYIYIYIYIHIYTVFFRFFSLKGYYKIVSTVPCAIQ